MEEFVRLENLIGKEKVELLGTKKVAIFGIGGVGGYVCEGLARCGVGEFLLVDFDKVALSNLNRQIIATNKTIGQKKVDLMKERILSINKNAKVECLDICVNIDNINVIDFSKFDFIVDAIDMVTSKLLIIENAKKNNTNIISCMETGKKLDPYQLKINDISKTQMCPLAKIIRKKLKDKNIKGVPVLYSTEKPIKNGTKEISSIVFVPAVAGLLIANYVITKLGEL